MKLFFAFTALAAAGFAAVNPGLMQVKRVYLVSMASSMDQYLANQLTTSGIFEVVTDPKRADAIITDNVGDSFQRQLDELYPPPKPPEEKKEAAKSDSDSTDTKATRKNAFEGIDFSGGSAHPNTFGRGKGNIFLVDRNSRVVLWSVYEPPKNSTPGELTKSAARVVKHLHDDMNPKKPGAEN